MSASRRPEKAAKILLGLFCLLPLGLKLFTVEVRLAEDPTKGVALRSAPSLASSEVLSLEEFDRQMFLLGPGENGFPGKSLYRALVRWLWPVPAALWALALIRQKLARNL